MSIQRMYLVSGLLVLFLGLCTITAGCQGSNPGTTLTGSNDGSWQAAVAEVENAPVPDGVDAELFAELQAELVRVIQAAAKETATPPTGNYNAVTTLVVTGNDTDGWRLEWDYINVGDYNLDGMVNVSDLTPIGQNFNATSSDANWDQAQLADGNQDGMVTVSDITPIGQNFQAFISAYAVYGADDPDGSWTTVGSFDLPSPFDPTQPLSYALPSNDYGFYRVAPVDGAGAEGVTSGVSMCTLSTPVVELGTETLWDSETVGPSGATLQSPATGNGIMSLIIPGGAIDGTIDFEFGANDGQVTRDGVPLDVQMVYFSASEYVHFDEPVQLAVPLENDDNALALVFRVLGDGRMMPVSMPEIDRDLDMALFDISMAFPEPAAHQTSDLPYMCRSEAELVIAYFLFDAITQGADNAMFAFHSGYNPKLDGFQIDTFLGQSSSFYSYGISAFTCWYYHNYMPSLGPLNIAFNDTGVQQLIANRACTSTLIGGCAKDQAAGEGLTMAERFELVKAAIRLSNGPVMVFHSPVSGWKAAYAYYDDFLVVNEFGRPGDQVCEYIPGCNALQLLGTDEFPMHESFENILLDATDDPPFGGSTKATIDIESHTTGQSVLGTSVTVSGNITSGAELVKSLYAYNAALPDDQIEEEFGFTGVPETGEFDIEIPLLLPGQNKIAFVTQAAVSVYEELGEYNMLSVPNNLEAGQFWLRQVEPGPDQMRIELTWPAPTGDVDPDERLHVHMRTPIDLVEDFETVDADNPGSLTSSPFACYEAPSERCLVIRISQLLENCPEANSYLLRIGTTFQQDRDSVRSWEGGTIKVYTNDTLVKEIAVYNSFESGTPGWEMKDAVFGYTPLTNEWWWYQNQHWD